MGIVAREQNDNATAKALYEESLSLRRELGDQWGIGAALNNLGLVVLHDGDYPAARELYGECLQVFKDLGNRQAMASPLSNLGRVAYQQGDYAGARALIKESLAIFWDLRDRWGVAMSLEGLAYVALGLATPVHAARLWGAAERLRQEIGCPLPCDRGNGACIGDQIELGAPFVGDANAFCQRARQVAADDRRECDFAAAPRVPGGKGRVGGQNALQRLRRTRHSGRVALWIVGARRAATKRTGRAH